MVCQHFTVFEGVGDTPAGDRVLVVSRIPDEGPPRAVGLPVVVVRITDCTEVLLSPSAGPEILAEFGNDPVEHRLEAAFDIRAELTVPIRLAHDCQHV